ncbi:MFS transporter [Spirochaeta lutea]|uniref:MFS transporter n=1 Tax=Spirochaeta lutea TaxID=1480694 RepID=UPI000691F301|nr:MFS transporter [Spirochaeta lutea]
MSAYILFLRAYPLHVGFGFLLTFFSSLGQTFLLSLYVPHILAALGISNGLFGTLYALATIGSSLLLMNFGGRIDHAALTPYVYKTLGLLSGAAVLLGLVYHPVLLPLALLGLRFGGQGLMSHISQTVMGRHFSDHRGKALSLSSLGYSVGEMIFPLVITLLIPLVGWRISLVVNALVMLAVMVPLLRLLPMAELDASRLSVQGDSNVPASVELPQKTPSAAPAPSSASRAQWHILGQARFWTMAPSIMMQSLIITAVFFYQLVLAEARGWAPEWYSMVFTGYAVSRFVFGLAGGPLVDRFTARRLFPLHLLPITLGLLILSLSEAPWAAVSFLFLAGVSMGSSGPIKAAVIAEVYGTANLGGIRSVFTAIMVFGTALGPMIFGWFLDAGLGFGPLLLASGVIMVAAIAPAFLVYRRQG